MGFKGFIKVQWFWYFSLLSKLLFGTNDFESRNTISYGFKLPYALKLDCEQSLRLSGTELLFKQTFTELTFSYKIIDDFSIIIPIRYAIFHDKVKNRYSFGGIYKFGKKPFKLKFKSRFQSTHVKDKDLKKLIRNKFYVHYKISKRVEPFLSYEIFNPAYSDQNSLEEYRLSFGTDFGLQGKKSLKLYYQLKAENLNKKKPDKTNILGLELSFN